MDHMEESAEFKNRKRKYMRKCGICGERYEQSDMIRTDECENGWMCEDCYRSIHFEHFEEEW